MGSSNTVPQPHVDSSFPMQKYINRGLTQLEIVKVKEAFDSFDPSYGYIHTSRVKDTSINSRDSH